MNDIYSPKNISIEKSIHKLSVPLEKKIIQTVIMQLAVSPLVHPITANVIYSKKEWRPFCRVIQQLPVIPSELFIKPVYEMT